MASSTTRSKYPASHEANRKKICTICGNKCKEYNGKWPVMNETLQNTVKLQYPEYNPTDDRFPLSICSNCRLNLGRSPNTLPERLPNFTDIVMPIATRAHDKDLCHCKMCHIASLRLNQKTKRGRGAVKAQRDFADAKLEDVQEPDNKKRSFLSICTNCKQEVGKGIPHPKKCSIASTSTNLVKQASNLPDKQKDQIISGMLNAKAAEMTGKQSRNINIEMTLSTKGKMANVILNPTKKKSIFFHEMSLLELQNLLGLSNNAMKKMSHWLRVHGGRKILPPYIRTKITAAGKKLDDVYSLTWMPFDVGQGHIENRPVFYGKAMNIVDTIMEYREMAGPCFIKVMADSGQGSFKISLAIIPENYNPETDSVEDDEQIEKQCRSTYASGGSCGQGKLTGVKRLIILANVPDISETYHNCQKLWKLTELSEIPYLLSADLKLDLIVLGLQTACSSYPCPYCLISLQELRAIDSSEEESDPNPERTFGILEKDLESYTKSGSKLAQAKDHHSTVNPPLLVEDNDVRTLDKVPLPELHLMEGVTNHTFYGKNGLVDVVGREKAMEWAVKTKVVSVGYHGEKFEGPECRKLLKNSDYLLSPAFLDGVKNPLSVIPLARTFQTFNKLVESCFGSGKLKGNVSDLLDQFIMAYRSTNLTVTLKAHIIFEHLLSNLANLGGYGMGLTSEQSGESIHHEFASKFWAKYKIDLIENPRFGENWYSANLEFCSKHV